ncbi:MAG: AhpC/TSA family protein [Muribaculaceae bacterium]|nr:AhpC/TSA family protein [Muribaculaceae bacterium]
MKNITALIVPGIAMALSACNAQAQPNYTLTFEAPKGTANTMLYLVDWDNGAKMDSAIVTGDTVRFEGTVETPFIGRLMQGESRGPIMIIEQGSITLDDRGLPAGTPLNDKLTQSIAGMSAMENEYRKLNQNDSIQRAKADSIAQAATAYPTTLYNQNKDNVLGLYWYLQSAYEKPVEQIEAEIKADPALASSARLKSVVEAGHRRLSTSVGQHYKDFTIEYDGKEQKLSDYVKPGEYTLVDFWASWCGPCMRQAKVLKELYSKYNGRGLNIVGVAVWDEPANTLAAIKSHGLEWPNIINAQTIPTDLYGINGIPCILLINPDGIIISRDKQSQELIDDVDKAMADFHPAEPAADASTSAAPADTASVIF